MGWKPNFICQKQVAFFSLVWRVGLVKRQPNLRLLTKRGQEGNDCVGHYSSSINQKAIAMKISRRKARWIGIASIAAVLLLQAFNSFACYESSVIDFFMTTPLFVGIPLLPAIASLTSSNPLRTVGGCLLFAPWLLLAYYTDCVRPYEGGGASMIYVAVFLWGAVSSFIGVAIAHFISKWSGIQITDP